MQKNSKFNLAVILGSGLGSIAESLPGDFMPSIKLDGIHRKRIKLVESQDYPMLLFSGRKHYYEGHSPESLAENVKISRGYGVKYLLVTNAAGGVNVNLNEADFVLINSHLNLNSKLKGKRKVFPYDTELMERFKKICFELGIKFHDGVYACIQGPAYETPAEIKMLKKIGADATGMSTVPEVYEAVKSGIKVLGVSVITNLLKENFTSKTSHNYVLKSSQKASEKLLFVIKRLANELK